MIEPRKTSLRLLASLTASVLSVAPVAPALAAGPASSPRSESASPSATTELDVDRLDELKGSPEQARRSIEGRAKPTRVAATPLELESMGTGLWPAFEATRDRLLVPIGAVALGFGLAGLAASSALLAAQTRPIPHRAATADTGVTLLVLSGVALTTGVSVLASGARCRATPRCGARQLGVLVGPTRIGVGFRF